MRLLFNVNILFPEGKANTNRLRTIGREMAKQGHDVKFVIPFARQVVDGSNEVGGIHLKWCYVPKSCEALLNRHGLVHLHVQLWARILAIFEILQLTIHKQYDWLYLYQPGLDGLIAAVIARLGGRRVCCEYVDLLMPNAYPGIFSDIIDFTLRLADRLVPLLSSVIFVISSLLLKRYIGFSPAARFVLVPTLVDSHLYGSGQRERYRLELECEQSAMVVYCGSLAKPQGLGNLIEAMALVIRKRPNTVLVIAGGAVGTESDDPIGLAKKHGVIDNVRFLGSLGLKDVLDLLAAADVFVMPKLDNIVNHAGFSTKLAEYLAAGRPVVASSLGEVPRYLQNKKHAMLYKPGNAADMAECILKLLSDSQFADSLATEARMVLRQHFDSATNVSRMLAALNDIPS